MLLTPRAAIRSQSSANIHRHRGGFMLCITNLAADQGGLLSSRLARRSFFAAAKPQVFHAQRQLPHTQTDLFKIISDIDNYKSFVPFCTGSIVTARSQDGLPSTADLEVGYKDYHERFSSKVSCNAPRSVRAAANKHPIFQTLNTSWHLRERGNNTEVMLSVEYAFNNPMYGMLSGAVVPRVADQIISAFEKRAKDVLTKPS